MLGLFVWFIQYKRGIITAQVIGRSMEPTLRDGDYVIGIRTPQQPGWVWDYFRYVLIRRQAIVLVAPPEQPTLLLIKRVDGLPGDVRSWQTETAQIVTQHLADQHVFVLSDATTPYPLADSRVYGPFPFTAILARIILTVPCPSAQGSFRGRLCNR